MSLSINLNSIILIFRRSAEFLSISDTLNLLSLNKAFKSELPNDEWFRRLCLLILSDIFNDQIIDDNNSFSLLSELLGCSFTNFRDIYSSIKHSYNLIKNPCGEFGFNYWNSYSGPWIIENSGCWSNKKSTYVSGAFWCHLTQIVEFPENSRPKLLVIGSPIRRKDVNGGEARLEVELIKEGNNKEKNVKKSRLFPAWKREQNKRSISIKPPLTEPDSQGLCNWGQLIMKIKLNKNYKKASISFYGKDEKYWKGAFGTRFGYCYARIFYVN
ncbi:unnamed protein product [Blepharisma stoltei]|uniref:FBA domain-containing protein n=1 Tax=Blepharisma stoltei TaxID=1481888 RepID=A0AAU9I6I9_9CILI|nr:unnamed protein product [Blepharisma stoltei]